MKSETKMSKIRTRLHNLLMETLCKYFEFLTIWLFIVRRIDGLINVQAKRWFKGERRRVWGEAAIVCFACCCRSVCKNKCAAAPTCVQLGI